MASPLWWPPPPPDRRYLQTPFVKVIDTKKRKIRKVWREEMIDYPDEAFESASSNRLGLKPTPIVSTPLVLDRTGFGPVS